MEQLLGCIVVLVFLVGIIKWCKNRSAAKRHYESRYFPPPSQTNYDDDCDDETLIAQEIRTKVVGVSFRNDDFISRQKYIKKCLVGDQIFLLHNPDNEHDPFAVEVYRESRPGSGRYQQIGFLGRHIAPDVAMHMDGGGEALAEITAITGGTGHKRSRGVNIRIMLL